MENKMICLDVDGTIVAKEGDFYPGVKLFCNELNKMGWHIVLCSARPIQSLMSLADQLICIDWICGLGGAVIAHKVSQFDDNKTVGWKIYYHTDYIDENLLIPIFEWGVNNNITDMWMYDLSKWYVLSRNTYVEREAYIINLSPTIIPFNTIPKDKILKLVFPYVSADQMLYLQNLIIGDHLLLNYSTNEQVEINSSSNYDKGISKLKELMFEKQKTIVLSIGDGENDLGMLLHSDIPITFEDSPVCLCEIARFVLDNDREKAYCKLINLIRDEEYFRL